MADEIEECAVRLTLGEVTLSGGLCIPPGAQGTVLFAHESGSSRLSPRNQFVSRELRQAGLATLLFDLLTREEERLDAFTGELRLNIRLLADRLVGATDWMSRETGTQSLNIGYFGASTGAAAAGRAEIVRAVVSRGGRPDLAGDALPKVKAPPLQIVGGNDTQVIDLNNAAKRLIRAETRLEIVPGATHLFEEPVTLRLVAELAAGWFQKHLDTRP